MVPGHRWRAGFTPPTACGFVPPVSRDTMPPRPHQSSTVGGLPPPCAKTTPMLTVSGSLRLKERQECPIPQHRAAGRIKQADGVLRTDKGVQVDAGKCSEERARGGRMVIDPRGIAARRPEVGGQAPVVESAGDVPTADQRPRRRDID